MVAAPVIQSVNGSVSNEVNVTWTAVPHQDNGGSPVYEYQVTGYKLRNGTNSSVPPAPQLLVPIVQQTVAVMSAGLPPPPIAQLIANVTDYVQGDDASRLTLFNVPLNIPLWYQVIARSARGWGNASALSNSFTSMPIRPDPPTAVLASYNSGTSDRSSSCCLFARAIRFSFPVVTLCRNVSRPASGDYYPCPPGEGYALIQWVRPIFTGGIGVKIDHYVLVTVQGVDVTEFQSVKSPEMAASAYACVTAKDEQV